MTSTLPGFLVEEDTLALDLNHYGTIGVKNTSNPGLRVVQLQNIFNNVLDTSGCAAIQAKCANSPNRVQCIMNAGKPLCLIGSIL